MPSFIVIQNINNPEDITVVSEGASYAAVYAQVAGPFDSTMAAWRAVEDILFKDREEPPKHLVVSGTFLPPRVQMVPTANGCMFRVWLELVEPPRDLTRQRRSGKMETEPLSRTPIPHDVARRVVDYLRTGKGLDPEAVRPSWPYPGIPLTFSGFTSVMDRIENDRGTLVLTLVSDAECPPYATHAAFAANEIQQTARRVMEQEARKPKPGQGMLPFGEGGARARVAEVAKTTGAALAVGVAAAAGVVWLLTRSR